MRTKHLGVVTAIAVATIGVVTSPAATAAGDVVAEATWSAGNGNTYIVVRLDASRWHEALADARLVRSGAHLATITSQEESDFVSGLTKSASLFGALWLGGFQQPINEADPAAGWTWVSGEPWGYENWAGGEPNDGGRPADEQHLTMEYWGGEWNDVNGENRHDGYVAEIEASATESLPLAPSDVVALPGVGRASVSWTVPSSDGGSPITGYTATALPGGSTCTTTGGLVCTVTGLTNGMTYTFTVTATNAIGTGPPSLPSAPATPTAPPQPLPPQPPEDMWEVYCFVDPATVHIRSTWRSNDVVLDGELSDVDEWSEADEWFFPLQLPWGDPERYDPCPTYMSAWFMNDDTWLYGRYYVHWPWSVDPDDAGGIALFRGDGLHGIDSDYGSVPMSTSGGANRWDAYNPDWDNVQGPIGGWFGDDSTTTGTIDIEGTGSHDGTGYWYEWRKPLDSGDDYDWELHPGDEIGDPSAFRHLMANFWNASAGVSFSHDFTMTLAAGPSATADGLQPVVPARLLETRTGSNNTTVDGLFEGIGRQAADTSVAFDVTGRGGVPADADAVMLNVTAVSPDGPGFLTVYPCGSDRPNASNVNYSPGDVAPNAVLAKVGVGGQVCIYTKAGTHLIADANGYVASGASPVPVAPARLLETRFGPQLTTVDGMHQGVGRRHANTQYELAVAGRAGVPADAEAVLLNLTAVSPDAHGFLTVSPCGDWIPLVSNVNYGPGDVAPNAVLAKLSNNGNVCIYTRANTHLIADVNGYVPAGGSPTTVWPVRVLETREGPNNWTIDLRHMWTGTQPAGSTLELTVAGRGGVPVNAEAVMLNLTAVSPDAPGYLTAYPCGEPRPNASNVNFGPGDIAPNAVLSKIGDHGQVCIYSKATTHLIADVSGYAH